VTEPKVWELEEGEKVKIGGDWRRLMDERITFKVLRGEKWSG